jgi:hypothetical protein
VASACVGLWVGVIFSSLLALARLSLESFVAPGTFLDRRFFVDPAVPDEPSLLVGRSGVRAAADESRGGRDTSFFPLDVVSSNAFAVVDLSS